MAPGVINPLTVFIQILFLLQGFQVAIGHRKMIHDDAWKSDLKLPGKNQDGLNPDRASPGLEPRLNVFFHYNTLVPGLKRPVYFAPLDQDPSKTPRLLSRQESDAIPFSSSQLPYLLKLFGFPADSKQALAVKSTIHHCELPALSGETKFCPTSLESMLDSVQEIFRTDFRIRVLTTNLPKENPPLQNYTVSESPEEIQAPKIIGCHKMPYPYAVYYCHGQAGDTKLYRVLLDGESGGRVEAVAICHMDTSQWDSGHVAFRVMKTAPGASPVCHFFPADNLIWFPGN